MLSSLFHNLTFLWWAIHALYLSYWQKWQHMKKLWNYLQTCIRITCCFNRNVFHSSLSIILFIFLFVCYGSLREELPMLWYICCNGFFPPYSFYTFSFRREKEDRMEARVPKVILAGRCSKSSVVLLTCTVLTDMSTMRLIGMCQGLYWRLKELALPIWPQVLTSFLKNENCFWN